MLGKQSFPSPPEPAALRGTFKSHSALLFSLCCFLVLCCTSLHSPPLAQIVDRTPLRQGEQRYTTAARRQQDEVHRVKAFSIPPLSLPSPKTNRVVPCTQLPAVLTTFQSPCQHIPPCLPSSAGITLSAGPSCPLSLRSLTNSTLALSLFFFFLLPF